MENREIRELVVSKAQQLIGTPYKFQGRTRYGLDCCGLLYLISESLDWHIEYPSNYSSPQGNSISDTVARYFTQAERLQPGDIVIFEFNGIPHHVGIIETPETFIHSLPRTAPSKDGVRRNWFDKYWFNKLVYVFDLTSYNK